MLKLLIPIIALLGLIFGHILSILAKEEVKPGKRYFLLSQKILLGILGISLLYFAYPFNYLHLLFFCLGIFTGMFIKKVYLFLGLASFLSFYIPQILIINIIILLFGLPYGTLLKRNKLTLNIILFLTPFLLYFISNYLILSLPYFLSFAAATLLPTIFISKDN